MATRVEEPRGNTMRGRRFPPEILTEDEVRALFGVCPEASLTGLRKRALLAVLYRSGLRIREALALELKNLDLTHGAIRVLRGKGGRSRVVGIDAAGMGMVVRWLEAREAEGLDDRHPVFCSLDGRRLRSEYIRVLFPRLARKAGLRRRFHAHALRHTHAAQLLAEDVDIGIISKQLGHRSIATTARYLDHIAPWDVVKAMREQAW